MTPQTKIPPSVLTLALAQAQSMMDEVTGVTAVVVASVDGFDVASVIRGNAEAARIAAMASSISAISTVVSHEAQLGRNKSVTIDTESGFAVVHSVHRHDAELVINVIADSSAILAQVNYRTAQFARLLGDA